ncbi:MAG: hypothetical protein ACI8RZ_005512 [Myxococcota bacterium]|jgi:hypothetical protein
MMEVCQSLGDVLDRITILELKIARIPDPEKVSHARRECDLLRSRWQVAGHGASAEEPALAAVNAELWEVEDALRVAEARADFGPAFVALARSVYHLNDRRAALKRAINIRLGSGLVEVKSYGSGSVRGIRTSP